MARAKETTWPVRWGGVFSLVVLASAAVFSPASAGEDIVLELNKLEPQGSACRAYLVLSNGSAAEITRLTLDLVLFDGDGVVARRVAVQGAPLRPGKTSLKVFDIDGLPCDGIGRILLNDVLACEDGSGQRDDCVASITVASRAGTPLIK